MMTSEIYYRDADTNTKYKRESISIQTDKLIGAVTGSDDPDADQYLEEEEKSGPVYD